MRKRKWKFLFALATIAVLVLILGEILIGLVWDLGLTASRIWLVIVVVATCAFSVWKCPR